MNDFFFDDYYRFRTTGIEFQDLILKKSHLINTHRKYQTFSFDEFD